MFYVIYKYTEWGEITVNDTMIFEMFLELMARHITYDSTGRMRILSQNPRYAEDESAPNKTAMNKRWS